MAIGGVQEPAGNPGNQNFHGKWLSGPRGGIPLVEADLRRAHVSPKPTATSWMPGGWNEDNVNQPVGIVQHEKIPLVGRFVGRFPLICWTIPTKKYQNYQLVGDSKSFSTKMTFTLVVGTPSQKYLRAAAQWRDCRSLRTQGLPSKRAWHPATKPSKNRQHLKH